MKYFNHITTKNEVTGEVLSEKQTMFYRREGFNECIPEAPGNSDYDHMLVEVAAGTSTIEEVDDTFVPTYIDKRQKAYGSIGDQLDMQYHDDVDGTTTWKDHVAAVKAANPKD